MMSENAMAGPPVVIPAGDNEQTDGTDPLKDKDEEETAEDQSAPECDAITYKGIYLPTLTNRFKDKKLETAYQRYACRQVRATNKYTICHFFCLLCNAWVGFFCDFVWYVVCTLLGKLKEKKVIG